MYLASCTNDAHIEDQPEHQRLESTSFLKISCIAVVVGYSPKHAETDGPAQCSPTNQHTFALFLPEPNNGCVATRTANFWQLEEKRLGFMIRVMDCYVVRRWCAIRLCGQLWEGPLRKIY
jgi:hypothetical protein